MFDYLVVEIPALYNVIREIRVMNYALKLNLLYVILISFTTTWGEETLAPFESIL